MLTSLAPPPSQDKQGWQLGTEAQIIAQKGGGAEDLFQTLTYGSHHCQVHCLTGINASIYKEGDKRFFKEQWQEEQEVNR